MPVLQDSAHLGESGLETSEIKKSKDLCDILFAPFTEKSY